MKKTKCLKLEQNNFLYNNSTIRMDLKMYKSIAIIFPLIALCYLFVFYTITGFILFGSNGFYPVNDNYISRNILLTLLTYLGIFFQNIYDEIINQKSKKINIIRTIKISFTSKAFWISVIVSPIVLMSVYKGIREIPDNLLAYTFAFENGFFFKSIINQKR